MSDVSLETGGFMDLISGVQGGDVEHGVELPIDDIYPDPDQPREEGLDDEGVMGIVNTFPITGGVIHPILVEEQADGQYMIIDGERRWRAAKYAGHETIKTNIQVKELETKYAVQVISNQSSVKLSPKDLAKSYLVLKEAGLNQKQIAACDPQKSESDISEIMQLNKLGVDRELDFIDELYNKNLCRDYSTLAVLIRLARKDSKKTEELVQWAIDNNSLTRSWAKSIKAKDFETPVEDQLAALEERIEREKKPATKTSVPAGMTGSENNGSESDDEFKLEIEQDGIEPELESENSFSNLETSEESVNEVESKKDQKLDSSLDKYLEAEKDEDEDELDFEKKKITEINVMHNERVAKLLLDRADKEEGFAWIEYNNSDEPVVRVDVSELSLIFVG